MFLEDDYTDFYDLAPNSTCADCGVDCSRPEDAPLPRYCDACSDRRDAHTTMLQHRLVMAKALHGSSALAGAPKLTAGEIAFCVALLGNGVTLEKAIDRIQAQRNRLPFFGGEAA